jgi:hypothetical protein
MCTEGNRPNGSLKTLGSHSVRLFSGLNILIASIIWKAVALLRRQDESFSPWSRSLRFNPVRLHMKPVMEDDTRYLSEFALPTIVPQFFHIVCHRALWWVKALWHPTNSVLKLGNSSPARALGWSDSRANTFFSINLKNKFYIISSSFIYFSRITWWWFILVETGCE